MRLLYVLRARGGETDTQEALYDQLYQTSVSV
jgi:hypothetical protein